MATEAAASELSADFSIIRYAQCWEDADVLLAGLDVQPGDVCLSIGSGGENSLSLLTCDPARVVAVDLSPAQTACLQRKEAGFRSLSHDELLELLGVTPSIQRATLYARLRDLLTPASLAFWDGHPKAIAAGINTAGKFEHYFTLFRRYFLPLVHTRQECEALFVSRSPEARRRYHDEVWNNRRWRLLFKVFFSRAVMGRLGRDPSFFRYVQGSVAGRIEQQVHHALTELDPADNPYLQWIVLGRFSSALPHALRPENFEIIRARIDRLEWRLAPIEEVLAEAGENAFDRFNMSDIFEYLSEKQSDTAFAAIAKAGRRGGRVAYWNMLAPRRYPQALAERFFCHDTLSQQLHQQARACFYSAYFVDELR